VLRSPHDREIRRIAIPALIGVRLVTLGRRFAGGRWAITGAAVARAPARAGCSRSR
jgi:hypothetical protein